MSTLKVDAIRHNSATSDAITTAADGTCTAKLTSIGGGGLSHRNISTNGACLIAQRGTSSTTYGYGSVDRFATYYYGHNEAPTHSQVDVASGTTPYSLGFRKALRVTNGNQTGGAGAAQFMQIQHKFEAQDIANSGWNYTSASSFITVQFWVKASVAQTYYIYLRSYDGTQQRYYFPISLSANTWTKVTKTIPGNSNLQFDNDENQGFHINWGIWYGTDYTASGLSAETWAAYASGTRVPDMTSTWWTTNDATFEITGVQLEVGDTATTFEHRSFADELTRCSRYCQVWGRGYCIANAVGSSDLNIGVPLTTPLRATPSATSVLGMHRSGNKNASCTFHSAQYTANTNIVEIRMGNWTGGSAVTDEVEYAVTPVSPQTMIIDAEI